VIGHLLSSVAFFGAPPTVGIVGGKIAPGRHRVVITRFDSLVPLALILELASPGSGSFLAVGQAVMVIWAAGRILGTPGRARVGLTMFAVGAALNAAVIAANGGMPYTGPHGDGGVKAIPVTATTHLAALADRYRILGRPISAGDIALAVGVAVLASAAIRQTHVSRPSPIGDVFASRDEPHGAVARKGKANGVHHYLPRRPTSPLAGGDDSRHRDVPPGRDSVRRDADQWAASEESLSEGLEAR
jgi:hypothetical protein